MNTASMGGCHRGGGNFFKNCGAPKKAVNMTYRHPPEGGSLSLLEEADRQGRSLILGGGFFSSHFRGSDRLYYTIYYTM